MQLSIINPLNYPGWDELLLSHPNCSIFHSSNWARVLHDVYGYKPQYFAEIHDGKLLSLIPCMEVNSIITGRRGGSLPFTDFCEPIISEKKSTQDFIKEMIIYGKKSGWKSIEIRSGNSLPYEFPPSSFYYGHTLELSKDKTFMTQQAIEDIENPSISPTLTMGGKGGLSDEKKIFSSFRDSTKRNIKKAVKEGVETNIYTSVESVREFYRLNCLTRREHGLPPQPWSFFKKIHDHIISGNLGSVILASFHNKTIAGAVYFNLGDRAIYKYGASDKNYQHLRANNLVMWEAIKWYTKNGYKSFCFGRTEQENKGLMQFKSGWGAKEHLIHYYKYDLIKEAFVRDTSKVKGLHNKIFKNMPIPLLKITGSLLYKHMG